MGTLQQQRCTFMEQVLTVIVSSTMGCFGPRATMALHWISFPTVDMMGCYCCLFVVAAAAMFKCSCVVGCC